MVLENGYIYHKAPVPWGQASSPPTQIHLSPSNDLNTRPGQPILTLTNKMVFASIRYTCGHTSTKFSLTHTEIRPRRPCKSCTETETGTGTGSTKTKTRDRHQAEQQPNRPKRATATNNKTTKKNTSNNNKGGSDQTKFTEFRGLPGLPGPAGETTEDQGQRGQGQGQQAKFDQPQKKKIKKAKSHKHADAAAVKERADEIVHEALSEDKKRNDDQALVPFTWRHSSTDNTNSNNNNNPTTASRAGSSGSSRSRYICTCPPGPKLADFMPPGMSLVPPRRSFLGGGGRGGGGSSRMTMDEYTRAMTVANMEFVRADRGRHVSGCPGLFVDC